MTHNRPACCWPGHGPARLKGQRHAQNGISTVAGPVQGPGPVLRVPGTFQEPSGRRAADMRAPWQTRVRRGRHACASPGTRHPPHQEVVDPLYSWQTPISESKCPTSVYPNIVSDIGYDFESTRYRSIPDIG
jgi:hypothetical protein